MLIYIIHIHLLVIIRYNYVFNVFHSNRLFAKLMNFAKIYGLNHNLYLNFKVITIKYNN